VTRATVEERMMQASKRKLVLEHLVVRAAAGRSLAPADLEDIIRYGAAALFSDDDRPRADKPAAADAGAGDGELIFSSVVAVFGGRRGSAWRSA